MATTKFVLYVSLLLRAVLSLSVSLDIKSVSSSDNVAVELPDRTVVFDPDTILSRAKDIEQVKSLDSVTLYAGVNRTKRQTIEVLSCPNGMRNIWNRCVMQKSEKPKQPGNCVVPAHPEHGEYIIFNAPTAKPGESFESLKLTVNCLPDYIAQDTYTPSGYLVPGTDPIYCVNGLWSHPLPKCVRFCKLDNNTSVHYDCFVNGSIGGYRTCNAFEPSGTVVSYECSRPNYPFITNPFMTCINGSWDHVPDCTQECGRVTSNDVALMAGGRPADRGELPWHVGIYRKPKEPCPFPCFIPYEQICGGSLVSNNVVISAAHCFWNPTDTIKKMPASRFAVAAGKIYRGWNNPRDVHAQKSDVKEINIPPLFQGGATHFHDDIAMVILKTPFEVTLFVGHVCLNFDYNFETSQLQQGRLGKVAGWGLTAENGNSSNILKVVELPYVNTTQCSEISPPSYKAYVTSDKFCAGYGNGTAVCRGDSGGGIVFPDAGRYYLRGIVSTAPSNENRCNIHALTTFTRILINEHFIISVSRA